MRGEGSGGVPGRREGEVERLERLSREHDGGRNSSRGMGRRGLWWRREEGEAGRGEEGGVDGIGQGESERKRTLSVSVTVLSPSPAQRGLGR